MASGQFEKVDLRDLPTPDFPSFELVRERDDPTKLWVRTPFPVTNCVWDYFVKEIFPVFDFSASEAYFEDRLGWGAKHRDERDIKYVNRGSRARHGRFQQNVAEIADGQLGFFWRHAYLPDDQRTATNTHDWGVVIVPKGQEKYLNNMEYDFDSDLLHCNADKLRRMQNQEQDMLNKLFPILERVWDRYKDSSFGAETNFVRASLLGQVSHHEFDRYIPNLSLTKFRNLPFMLYGSANNLSSQVILEFSRIFDAQLTFPTVYPEQLREAYLNMQEMYAPLVEEPA